MAVTRPFFLTPNAPSLLDQSLFRVAAAGTALLLIWTAWQYPGLTLALVASCAAMFWVCAWSATRLLGHQRARALMLLALGLGWFAEQMGSSHGWFFGRYTYTEVLGPRLGDVPLAIPLMWFALTLIGYVMASLMLWRQPVHAHPGFRGGLLTAWVAAMVITAFDLGADPYFVFVLKAWVMHKTDGGWFGETLQGFAGWMAVSLVIVGVFQALAAPRRAPPPVDGLPLAVLLPIIVYASGLVFQVLLGHPIEVRAIAFFAMGLPVVLAWAAWRQWSHPDQRAAHARGLIGRDLAAMAVVADPSADETIAALIVGQADDSAVAGPGADRLAQASQLMSAWTHNAALAPGWAAGREADPAVVAALEAYVARTRALPDWADPIKIARAESIFMEHGPLSCTLLFCSSLPECYVMPQLAQVLHIAGQLEQHTEHRIRQTAAMVFPVMMKGGLTNPEGSGVAQVLKVRLIHATIRHLILRGDPKSVRGRVPPQVLADDTGRPMHRALAAHGWDVDAQGLPCNQIELAYTLLTFSYSFLKGMRTLGLGLPRADEDDYLHAWNVMGHVLGVRRELMAWTMDEAETLFDALQTQAPLMPGQADPRPPLGRALVMAMGRSIGLPVLRGLPVPMTRWLVGPETAARIGIDGYVSWATRLVFLGGRLLVGVTDGVVGLVVSGFSLSRLLTRAVGYHLLTRFLLDQTRPLALPERVLNPMGKLIASWGNDPHAPGWVNRLEDRLTTSGDWHRQPIPGARATNETKTE